MASQRGIRLIQDQNLSLSFAGSGSVGRNVNGSKVQKKGTVGGRKPLGDLSNAGKQPSLNQTLKKQSSKSFSVIEEETIVDSSKFKSHATKKRGSIGRTADKAQLTSRKALADISNSEKLSISEKSRAPEALKKDTGAKLGVLAKDSILADAISEEQFLHNHKECIKMQACAMDKDCLLQTLGLDKGLPKQFASPWVSPVSKKPTPDSPTRYKLLYEEMVDEKLKVSSGLDSPNPCQTPSPDQYSHWKKDQEECVNFMLMESPKSKV